MGLADLTGNRVHLSSSQSRRTGCSHNILEVCGGNIGVLRCIVCTTQGTKIRIIEDVAVRHSISGTTTLGVSYRRFLGDL